MLVFIHVFQSDNQTSEPFPGVLNSKEPLRYNSRSNGRTVEHRTVNRGDGGTIPPTAVSILRQFHSPHICLCLSEETLKAGGVYARGSKRSHTGGKCVTCSGLTNFRRQLLR